MIFSADFQQKQSQIKVNDKIRAASTFHALSAMACEISPVENTTGLTSVIFDGFKIHCKQTLTGLSFILVTSPSMPARTAEETLFQIYQAFADHVMKNPYYTVDMPVRVVGFTKAVQKIVNPYSF